MIKPILQYCLVLTVFLCSCQSADQSAVEKELPKLKEGAWRVTMDIPGEQLPFVLEVHQSDSAYSMVVYNDIEEILVKDVRITGDSIFISMPVFQSELVGEIKSDSLIVGQWNNYTKGPDYKIPFEAKYGKSDRFNTTSGQSNVDVSGKWEVTFSEDSENPCKAIGLFKQNGEVVSGTFLTETGDFRFLEGKVVGDTLMMSCFDGSHAFLFKAGLNEKTLKGMFWSGNHWKETWTAVRNDAFELSHPDSLTFLKEGYDRLSFSFPNEDSVLVSLENDQFKDKVVIVQIMGSWCPNCADEVDFLASLHNKYHEDGLEIVALAYEKNTEFGSAFSAINKMKDHYGAQYDFLLAGKASKKKAQETLPMLNHIMSYPTCIFIDRQMNIRKIRTGFYGPGTGEIYEQYTSEIERFTKMLLKRSEV